MTPSELMKALADAGAPMEAIIIALRALEAKDAEIAARDAAAADKRAKDAERKREERALSRVHGQSTDSPATVQAASAPVSLSLPPNDINSNPPTHTHENNKPARVKGHRLPADWQPTALPADLAAAVALWPLNALERELSRFRDWAASATGPNAIKLDWQAAWRNWVRKAEDEGRYGRNVGKPPGAPPDDLAARILKRQAANA